MPYVCPHSASKFPLHFLTTFLLLCTLCEALGHQIRTWVPANHVRDTEAWNYIWVNLTDYRRQVHGSGSSAFLDTITGR